VGVTSGDTGALPKNAPNLILGVGVDESDVACVSTRGSPSSFGRFARLSGAVVPPPCIRKTTGSWHTHVPELSKPTNNGRQSSLHVAVSCQVQIAARDSTSQNKKTVANLNTTQQRHRSESTGRRELALRQTAPQHLRACSKVSTKRCGAGSLQGAHSLEVGPQPQGGSAVEGEGPNVTNHQQQTRT
jgi:hypothetical protein